MLEALLSYWLFWFLLLRGPENGLKQLCVPTGDPPRQRRDIGIGLINLGSLFALSDECVGNIALSMGRYNMRADTSFL